MSADLDSPPANTPPMIEESLNEEIVMRLKHLALGTLVCVTGLACLPSHADTLKLVSTSSTTVSVPNPEGAGNVNAYIYPYNFSIDGSSTLTSLMCISMNDEIVTNESWAVTETTLTSKSSQDDLAAAWLFSQVGSSYNDTEIQLAAWDLTDSAAASSSSWTSTDTTLVKDALAAAALGDPTLNLSQFTLYTPSTCNGGSCSDWTDGTPQTFIGEGPAPTSVTPEPSSLLLLGSGLLAAAVLVLRRRNTELLAEL